MQKQNRIARKSNRNERGEKALLGAVSLGVGKVGHRHWGNYRPSRRKLVSIIAVNVGLKCPIYKKNVVKHKSKQENVTRTWRL